MSEATGFSAAELEGFTAADLSFWWSALMAGRRMMKDVE